MKKSSISVGVSIIIILILASIFADSESSFIRKLPDPVLKFIKGIQDFGQTGFTEIKDAIDRWFERITGYTLTETLKTIVRAVKNFIIWVYKLVLKILEWVISLFP